MRKRAALFLAGIFLFITAIEGVKSSWGLIGSQAQQQIITMIEAGTIPVVGVAIGLLATSLVQSSSAVVAATMASLAGMVASGMPMTSALTFGVPVVLGANVGTTVTNSMVALGHSRDKKEFDTVVPGAIVHDIFNVLNISLFFGLEMTTGLLSKTAVLLSQAVSGAFSIGAGSVLSFDLLRFLIEKPIIAPLAKLLSRTFGHLFGGLALLLVSFGGIVLSLSVISSNVKKLVNTTSLKGKISAALKSPFRSVLTGTSVCWTLQSSSIATSLALPFLAAKTIDLKDMYAYTLGCNIGTTIDMSQIYGYMASGIAGISLGVTHILINTIGVTFWLFTPLKHVPPTIAKRIGNVITSNRMAPLFLIGYVGAIFFVLPFSLIFLL